MTDLENLKIKLTQEEWDILRGKQGPTMQKVMRTVVLYGEALGAERLVNIEGDGHFVIAYAIPGIAPSIEMLDELVADDEIKDQLRDYFEEAQGDEAAWASS